MAYYALREPPGTAREDIELLVAAAANKSRLVGVYWSPRLRRLLAVFREPLAYQEAFERLPSSALEGAYRMECPRGCGFCCAVRSGAFVLDVELRGMPGWARRIVEKRPYRVVETRYGPVRVYRLSEGPLGSCVFFNPETGGCRLEERAGRRAKPIVCLLTYCTLFATGPQGRALRIPGSSEPRYRPATRREWAEAVEALRRRWLRLYARVGRVARGGGGGGTGQARVEQG